VKPTNYWMNYQRSFLPELKRRGLKDFRRRKESVLGLFGATDLLIQPRVHLNRSFRGAGKISVLLNMLIRNVPFVRLGVLGVSPQGVTPYFYKYIKQKMDRLGLDINACHTTLFGNPEDIIEINGHFWSTAHLQYVSMTADALMHMKLREDPVVCELGTGLGRNIEVMAQLFNRGTFLVFDIPPQLYVANQYLGAVFGNRVVPYREAVKMRPGGQTGTEKIKGKILVLPTWEMHHWAKNKIDLFWNSASFQEMEPDVVGNYLRLVNSMSPEWIYINALPQGNYWGKPRVGGGGTLAPVTEQSYFEALKESYRLVQTYETDDFLRQPDHRSYVFAKQTGEGR